MANKTRKNLLQKAKKIKILLLDVDGILTSGLVHILSDGSEFYSFNVHDGFGIKLWHRAGFKTGFITGRGAEAVKHRAEKLGIHFLFQNSGDKLELCETLIKKEGVGMHEIAYIGDDLQDLPLLKRVGFSASVPNGRKEVVGSVDYVTNRAGGEGAVREIVEHLLQAKGLWDGIVSQERILS